MDKKYSILVVDDEPLNLIIVDEILTDAGKYEVSSVESGEACLDALKEQTPDLILLDVNMPGISGIEVCSSLRKQEQYKDLPIIFLSALASEEEQEEGLSAGGTAYVTKPFVEDELLNILASAL